MRFLCVLLLLISVKSFAQYPFEKFPAKKYDSTSFKTVPINDSINYFVANYKGYRIKLLEYREKDSSNLFLYHKNKLIKKIKCDFDFFSTYLIPTLYIADINGDGLIDFKFSSGNVGASGLASSRVCMVYLFNRGNNMFSAISFMDFFYGSHKEYQFNDDNKYEIIGQRLVYYKGHNYWLFDLYNYENGKLINVSKKYNYPIAIQYLERENYTVTNKISKTQLQRLSLKLPEFYKSY